MHLRVVVPARGQAREVADVDDRRCGVERASSLGPSSVTRACERVAARRAGAAERRPAPHPGRRAAGELVGPRHPDLAELLREALDPAAGEREVLVDPDERAGRDLLAVEQRVDHEVELAVVRARRVEQLVAALRAGLPVGEDGGAAAGVGMRVQTLRQHRDRRLGIGVEVDDEEVADVVPRRRRHQARLAARRARDRVALERHVSVTPCISRLSRSEATAASSKRK